MTRPRKELVKPEVTPYYHVVSRCVRRHFLCGQDPLTGKDFSYRRDWIKNRLHQLAGVFAINICAYAVMSNHFHGVVQIDSQRAQSWLPEEVAQRWVQLFSGPDWLAAAAKRKHWTQEERAALSLRIAKYRQRLSSLSWFMRCLNEQIARRANREDDVEGHFWQGRFKSQALLDEAAVLSAMVYVELNPVRAGLVDCPEDCAFASAKIRAEAACSKIPYEHRDDAQKVLVPFEGECSPECPAASVIPAQLGEYLELLDWSGRLIKAKRTGRIPDHCPPILTRLGLSQEGYADYIQVGGRPFHMMGHPATLLDLAARNSMRRSKGQAFCGKLYLLDDEIDIPSARLNE